MIPIKSKTELAAMRVSGRMTAEVLRAVCDAAKPGVTTGELDELTRRLIAKTGGRPVFLGYGGFPAAACISVNEEVIHGIPGNRIIQDGDLVSIDVGVEYKGFIGDTAFTVMAGKGHSPEVVELVQATQASLMAGIAQVKAGVRLGNVSHAVQQVAEAAGCSVVRDFVGHGVGRKLHEAPEVRNFGSPNSGPVLKAGMTICIEPMVNRGSPDVRVLKDNWTVVTCDGKFSAHFEHTVAVIDDGVEILTQLD